MKDDFFSVLQKIVLEKVPLGILLTDSNYRIMYHNRRGSLFLGEGRSGLIGADLSKVVARTCKTGVAMLVDKLRALKKEKESLYSSDVKLTSGFECRVTLCAIRDVEGIVEYLLVIFDNLSEQKKLQQQLLQSSKMAAVGQLAAGVAHELNNPLAIIKTYVDVLNNEMKVVEVSDTFKIAVAAVGENTDRAANIIDQLRNFARTSHEKSEHININELLKKTMDIVRHQFKSQGIKIIERYGKSVPDITGNTNKLQQVFVNLLVNARDAVQAMKNDGCVTVSTRVKDKQIVVRVNDNGVGIPYDDLKNIFNPFYTTKEVGKGMGLGLSIVHRIVEEHGGSIFVESAKQQGAAFILTFPT